MTKGNVVIELFLTVYSQVFDYKPFTIPAILPYPENDIVSLPQYEYH